MIEALIFLPQSALVVPDPTVGPDDAIAPALARARTQTGLQEIPLPPAVVFDVFVSRSSISAKVIVAETTRLTEKMNNI